MERTKATLLAQAVAVLVVLASGTAVLAEDVYFDVPLRELKITEGKLPENRRDVTPENWRRGAREPLLPRVVLDGPGEAFPTGLVNPEIQAISAATGAAFPETGVADARLTACVPKADKDVTGRLWLPKPDGSGMVMVRFSIPASATKPKARDAFLATKHLWYQDLSSRNLPGAAWFRYQADATAKELGDRSAKAAEASQRRPQRPGEQGLSRSFELFSGGRAVSENLQLDRDLLPRDAKGDEVAVDSLPGITVNEIDWQPLVKDLKPRLDPLASRVPADQHVVFFPTFSSAVRVADEAGVGAMPILYLAEPRSEDARTEHRYQRQLCLSMSGLSRLLGPHLAKSVALTGSDSYYPTGTDVAILFETPSAAVLETLLLGRITLGASQHRGAQAVQGIVGEVAYRGFRSPDRAVCVYLAKLDGAVVVTNSPMQIQRLAEVRQGKSPSIASLPEYRFFRDRYRLGDAEEQALIFLSDATIRRWCGPRWRIANSRRVRDAAVMAQVQASQMDRLIQGEVVSGLADKQWTLSDGARPSITPQGVFSSTMGTLGFMTPIVELSLDKATAAEAEAYKQWREQYQAYWRGMFDPIALRVTFQKEKLAADLSVMPLILRSQYSESVRFAGKAHFGPGAADPHRSLVQVIHAIDTESETFRMASGYLSNMVKGGLGWIGKWASLAAEEDPFWKELAEAKETEKFFRKEFHRLPVVVQIESTSGLRLAAFLTGIRAYSDQAAHGMTQWENLTYHDEPYVKITPTDRARNPEFPVDKLAIYYAATGESLVVTLREDLLKQVLDRQIARRKAKAEGKPAETSTVVTPWQGSSVALRADAKVLDLLKAVLGRESQSAMQARAWSNLPILNQWKHCYPKEDPLAVHERFWQTKLVCPGGGEYVWNEAWQTMESTVYGHPGEPKTGPAWPPVLDTLSAVAFGITFEHQGLRARATLERK